ATCIDGMCAACTPGEAGDLVCAENDAATPRCRDGGCVECLDNADCDHHADDAPHCDQTSGSCTVCRQDDECSTGVCDESEGRCLDAAELIHVAAGGA